MKARATPTGINVNWLPPLHPNGLVNYTVYYRVEGGSRDLSVITNDTFVNLENLEKFALYRISVQSYNREKLLPSSDLPFDITIRTQAGGKYLVANQ